MLVTTGGASVGDHDLVIEGLKARGMTLDFWQIAMRPGKPLLFGQLGANPGARPARQPGLGAWSARSCSCCRRWRVLSGLPGRAAAGLPRRFGARRCTPTTAEPTTCGQRLAADQAGRIVATPFPVQDSAMLRRLA